MDKDFISGFPIGIITCCSHCPLCDLFIEHVPELKCCFSKNEM